MDRLDHVVALIDASNAADPNTIVVDGALCPAELAYGRRMAERLAAFRPDASELLRIAARAQHLERWRLPRSAYPMDRAGYLRWRNEQKRRHAARVAELMRSAGYADEDCARVQDLVEKRNLKRDADAQALEDVACLVFVEHYMAGFAAGRDPDHVAGIVAKTWRKMSAEGRAAAAGLAGALPPDMAAVVSEGARRAAEGPDHSAASGS
ncbi:DUF4202 domain-containing protein [Faunimonas sp. B44]|uniref:DUF4202 domain-containing protein n=1 Tax=Faunimonas sp. B44 TaxID=3461493 RepID=UPI0040444E29